MQCDEIGKNHEIAYASRTLNLSESNYSLTPLEIIALVFGLKHFREIKSGDEITVYTDHAVVTELFKGKKLNGKACIMVPYYTKIFTQVQNY